MWNTVCYGIQHWEFLVAPLYEYTHTHSHTHTQALIHCFPASFPPCLPPPSLPLSLSPSLPHPSSWNVCSTSCVRRTPAWWVGRRRSWSWNHHRWFVWEPRKHHLLISLTSANCESVWFFPYLSCKRVVTPLGCHGYSAYTCLLFSNWNRACWPKYVNDRS